jgi:protein-L-isoaspartate(D-aspartate) O-methyltransferase
MWESARRIMLEDHLRGRGVTDPAVLAAMAAVRREAFVSAELQAHAYDDRPLPIACGQTISQPYVVALMAEALRLTPADAVLEIGTGSGYAAAVLSQLARRVDTIERHPLLADEARQRLAALGYRNVEVRCGDGTLGWPEHAPYDAILVSAGAPAAPPPLLEQLAIGGRLVMPVGTSDAQQLRRITRRDRAHYHDEDLGAVQFVPLIGAAGWAEPADPAARGRGRR